MKSSPSTSKNHVASSLLSRAHSPDTTTRIFREKILHKPLLLRASSPPPATQNAREQRQRDRLRGRDLRRKSNKPRPLNAKQKRALGVYEIPVEERKYQIYVPLKKMWEGYIREVLGISEDGRNWVAKDTAGPMLASADFHGAEMEVVRCRSVSRVGLKGIVVKDLKFVFELITRSNEIKCRCFFKWLNGADPCSCAERTHHLQIRSSSLRRFKH